MTDYLLSLVATFTTLLKLLPLLHIRQGRQHELGVTPDQWAGAEVLAGVGLHLF